MNEKDALTAMISAVSQRVSFQIADLICSYPEPLRPLAMATVSACIASELATMPKAAKEMYDLALPKMQVITVPRSWDPRKGGGKA